MGTFVIVRKINVSESKLTNMSNVYCLMTLITKVGLRFGNLVLCSSSYAWEIKGTPGYKNKLSLIDSQLLLKTNGANYIFIEKLVKFRYCTN